MVIKDNDAVDHDDDDDDDDDKDYDKEKEHDDDKREKMMWKRNENGGKEEDTR